MSATPTPSPDALPVPEGARHTPGPLRAEDGLIRDANGRLICEVWTPRTSVREDRANARLWAASPELLATAQAFVAPYADHSDEWLRDLSEMPPDPLWSAVGTYSLTLHTAASILAFRAAIRVALTGER